MYISFLFTKYENLKNKLQELFFFILRPNYFIILTNKIIYKSKKK